MDDGLILLPYQTDSLGRVAVAECAANVRYDVPRLIVQHHDAQRVKVLTAKNFHMNIHVASPFTFRRSNLFIRLGRHNAVQLGILRETVHERQDRTAIKKQPFAFATVRDIRELMRGDIELLGENLPVAAGLIEHEDEIAVLKDVLHLAGGEQVVG